VSIIERNDRYSITAALLWGINYVAVKSVLNEIPENSFLLIRFTIAVVILLLYLAATGEGIQVQRSDIIQILLLGILGVGAYNIFWTVGIHLTTASNAALIVSTSPLFTQLYMQFVNKEKISIKRWAFTFLAFYGIFIMISKSPQASFNLGSQFFIGNILVFIGALLFAAYTIFAKPLLQHYSPVKLNALAMLSGLPLLIVYCTLSGPLIIGAVSSMTFFKMFYIIAFGTVAAYICWYSGIKKAGPIKVILFHYIVPVSSMLLGALFLGESVNLAQVFGGILALGGIIAAKLE
jgi:drug/metabolite transporter (DMT)-like permease